MYSKLTVFIHFSAQTNFSAQNIAKYQHFTRNDISRTIKERKSQVPDKSRSFYKISQKKSILWVKKGLFKVKKIGR